LSDGVHKTPKGFGRSENIAAPWCALLNTTDRRGVSIAFLGDKLRRLYTWTSSTVAPTFEWMYAPLEPGTRYSTSYLVKIDHGFTGVSDSTRLYTAESAITPAKGLSFKVLTRLAASWQDLPAVTLQASIRPVAAKEPLHAQTLTLGAVAVAGLAEAAFDWTAPADGAYILDVAVLSAGKEIGRYEEVFTAGKADKKALAAYSRDIRWNSQDPVHPVAGWKKVERYTLQPTPEQRRRGHIVFEEFGPDAGKDLAQVAATVGVGEKESICLGLAAFSDIGAVALSARPGSLPLSHIRLTAAELVPAQIWGKTHLGHKLTGAATVPTQPGQESWFWVLLDSAGLAPGDYAATLVLTPEKGQPRDLPIALHVAPVELPPDLPIFFTPNSLFNYLASSGRDRQWDERKGRLYARDMRDHGIRVLCAYGPNAPGFDLTRIRLRQTGQPLLDAIRQDPASFRAGPLPALDLSYWDPMVNLALEYDQYIYRTALGDEHTYAALFKQASDLIYGKDKAPPDSEEHARVRRWLVGAIPQYLREKGFRRILATIGDEIPFDRFHSWAAAAAEARSLGFETGVTTSLRTLMDPVHLKMLASASDYWIIGTLNDEYLAKARRDGHIKPADWVETYCSSANYWQRYETMRRWAGWWPAFFELDAVWIQEYWRWNKTAAVIFPDDENGPLSSGAWEGCRDGLEDANYYLMALDLLRALERKDSTAGAAAKSELEAIIGKRPNSLVAFQVQNTQTGPVLQCMTTDTAVFRKAKAQLLDFIIRHRGQVPPAPPLVRWGSMDIASQGKAIFAVTNDPSLQEAAAGLLAHINARSGLAPNPSAASTIAITTADSPFVASLVQCGLDTGLTPLYPGPGSYVIREFPGPGQSRLIAIIGRDKAGAELGARNAARFIRRVRPLF
ncbi:MAG TPA: hypothetical protein P5137_09315, partial [Candidatus Brocadiia bacterium]|nr:hypothetical protein [Candidatus Brocadiia bacterium]